MHCAPCTQEKTFRVVENRCFQCVESIFVNLPQFVKACVKESLNRFSWYFSLHLLDILVWYRAVLFLSVCFTAELLMAVPSKRTVGRPLQRGSPKYISLCESIFLISGEMGNKLLAANSTDTMFAEFLLHWMFNRGPVEICWKQIKRVNLTWTMLYLI